MLAFVNPVKLDQVIKLDSDNKFNIPNLDTKIQDILNSINHSNLINTNNTTTTNIDVSRDIIRYVKTSKIYCI